MKRGKGMAIASINPATGETLKTFDALTPGEIDGKLARAEQAFRVHRRTPIHERAERMARAAEVLESDKDRFARLMTTEMGKPLTAAVAEVEKCARVCRHYAERAKEMLAPRPVD